MKAVSWLPPLLCIHGTDTVVVCDYYSINATIFMTRKRLSNTTWVLGDKPRTKQQAQLLWTDGKPVGKANGKKSGPQRSTIKLGNTAY